MLRQGGESNFRAKPDFVTGSPVPLQGSEQFLAFAVIPVMLRPEPDDAERKSPRFSHIDPLLSATASRLQKSRQHYTLESRHAHL
jgi:hypothetical protein